MAPLHRAVAFEKGYAAAMRVGEYLNFDMPWPAQIFFDQQAVVAKGGLRFALRAGDGLGQCSRLAHDAHSAPAAAARRLDQHGKADALGRLAQASPRPSPRRDSRARSARRRAPSAPSRRPSSPSAAWRTPAVRRRSGPLARSFPKIARSPTESHIRDARLARPNGARSR